jgi:hypothetical protein
MNSRNPKHLFLDKLFLLCRNKKQKMMISRRNHDGKQKHVKLSKGRNINATTENSNDKDEGFQDKGKFKL